LLGGFLGERGGRRGDRGRDEKQRAHQCADGGELHGVSVSFLSKSAVGVRCRPIDQLRDKNFMRLKRLSANEELQKIYIKKIYIGMQRTQVLVSIRKIASCNRLGKIGYFAQSVARL
jgi:hypothetical protein